MLKANEEYFAIALKLLGVVGFWGYNVIHVLGNGVRPISDNDPPASRKNVDDLIAIMLVQFELVAFCIMLIKKIQGRDLQHQHPQW